MRNISLLYPPYDNVRLTQEIPSLLGIHNILNDEGYNSSIIDAHNFPRSPESIATEISDSEILGVSLTSTIKQQEYVQSVLTHLEEEYKKQVFLIVGGVAAPLTPKSLVNRLQPNILVSGGLEK